MFFSVSYRKKKKVVFFFLVVVLMRKRRELVSVDKVIVVIRVDGSISQVIETALSAGGDGTIRGKRVLLTGVLDDFLHVFLHEVAAVALFRVCGGADPAGCFEGSIYSIDGGTTVN